jgi:ATP-dependent Clp protease ATP-binding subunit ClpC
VNGYTFTESVRTSLRLAREESTRLHHEYVGTEHMLLGLIAVKESTGRAILETLGADCDEMRRLLEATIKKGPNVPTAPDLPYTSRAKKVLELSMAEARELGHSYVGTEHLILGLLREEKGIAAQVMAEAGLTLETTRAELVRFLRDGSPAESPVESPAELPPRLVMHPTTLKVLDVQTGRRRPFRFSLPLAFLGGVAVGWLLHLL